MEPPMIDSEKESAEYRKRNNQFLRQTRAELVENRIASFFLSAVDIQRSGGVLKPAVGVQDFSLRIAPDGKPKPCI